MRESAGNSGLGCGGPRYAAFGKGLFESGVAAKVLREFAQDPFSYLDEAQKKNMIAAQQAQRAKAATEGIEPRISRIPRIKRTFQRKVAKTPRRSAASRNQRI
jgi:hypothetical protein